MEQLSLFSDEEMGKPLRVKKGNKQPTYPVKAMVTCYNKNGELSQHPLCYKPKEVFVEQANAIWHGKYDYTDSDYKGNKEPIVIYCPKHDYHFRVAMAQNHVMKRGTQTGCPICRAEQTHNREYGKDWCKYLKVCARNNRVGLIENMNRLSEEEKARRKAEREKKRLQNDKRRLQREANQALIEKYNAKNLKEALFLEKLHAKYGDRYGTELLDYQNGDQKITLVCPEHGPFQTTSRLLFQNSGGRQPHGCWKCEGITPPWEKPKPKVYDSDEFFAKMHELYGNRFDFSKSVYVNMHTPITFICNKHGEQRAYPQALLEGKGCKYCEGKFYPPDWIKMAQAVHGNKYQYVGEPPRIGNDMIQYICPKHGIIEQRFDVHVRQGCECPYCKNYTRLPLEERREKFLKDFHKKHGQNHFDLSEMDYVNNDTEIIVTCNIHHYRYKTTPDNLLRGAGGCPFCSSSEGEAAVRGWLENHGIKFEHNTYQIPNENPLCRRQYLVPDFWLPDYNMFIEYNGEQHYIEVDHFSKMRDWSLEDQQIRDQTLRDYCERHGVNLLEIHYSDLHNVPKILSKNVKVSKK